jgi:hypothetical protein
MLHRICEIEAHSPAEFEVVEGFTPDKILVFLANW